MKIFKKLLKYLSYLALLCLLVIVILNYSYDKDINIPPNVAGKHIEIESVKLRVQQIGQGPDLLFLHASVGNLEDLEAVLPYLSGYRITLFDRIGHGYSAMPAEKANIENNARYASALIKALKLKEVTLIGHSYGGSIALKMAINHDPNIKSLVLFAPAAFSLSPTSKLEHLLAKPVIGLGLIRLLHKYIAEEKLRTKLNVSLSPNQSLLPNGFVDNRVALWNNPGTLFTRTQQTSDASAELKAMENHYKNITLPVSILIGRAEQHKDIVQGCKLLVKELKQGQLIEIEGAGHYLQYKAPKQIGEIIKRHNPPTRN